MIVEWLRMNFGHTYKHAHLLIIIAAMDERLEVWLVMMMVHHDYGSWSIVIGNME